MTRIKLFFLYALMLPLSCTVKESREGSPCTLYEYSGDMYPLKVTLWRDSGILDEASSNEPKMFEFWFDRGITMVTAVSKYRNVIYNNNRIGLLSEFPVDSIYAYRNTLDCNAECVRDTVRRYKQFATVTVNFNISPRHERFPDSLRVISAWEGLDIITMEATRGSYGYTFPCTGTTQSFRVLRQGDDSLILRLTRRGEGTIDNVALGVLLRKAGYNWDEEDLDDITVNIEEAGINLRIIVTDWGDGEPVIMEI